jgi:hypothetical protein
MANIGSKCLSIPLGVFVEEIFERSVKIKSATVDPALATRSGAESTKDLSAIEQEDLANQAAQVMLVEALWTKPYLAYLL